MKHQDYFKIIDFPGPGAYEGKKSKNVPLGKFGTSKREGKSTHYESPGPGSYSQPSSLKTNGWTIQGKRHYRNESNDSGLGPGAYLPNIKQQTPAWTIGSKPKKKDKHSDGPGPCAYFPSIHSTKPRAKSATFTQGRREKKYNNNMPGPGDYMLKSTLGGPAYGIKGRPSTAKTKDGPGPGTYYPNKN